MIKKISTSLFSCFLVCLLGLTTAQASNQKNKLPEIGVVASSVITLDKEIQIGDALMRQLRGQAPLINDPLLDEYIQDIGNRLVAQADNVKFPYKFFLINNLAINAFAFFGGHIGVHSGLIIQAKNESELASVLAHEVSHVTQRHIARRMEAQQKASPLQIASLLGGILLAAVNPEAGMAAISVGNAASSQMSINYTRHNEKEADRVGIHILAQAGFDPNAAATFFQTLTEKNRLKSEPMAFLLTHPLPETRVADARTRAATYRTKEVKPSVNFYLARSRILARYYANPSSNIAYFSDLIENKKYQFRQAAEYGLALSYFGDEQYKEAEKIINKLLNEEPSNLFYLDTFTDISIELKQYQQAIDLLAQQRKHAPHNQVLSLNLANALIKHKHPERAIEILKDFLLVKPNHMLAIEILSDAYKENDQKLEMHQTKAEIYALVGAYPRAIDELQTAYNFATDRNLEKQRIRARIEQFRSAQDKLESL